MSALSLRGCQLYPRPVVPRCSLLTLALFSSLVGCGGENETPSSTGCDELELDERVACLVDEMTLDEKMSQMHGSQIYAIEGLFETPAVERLGIEGMKMVDGPRGVRAGNATAFPVGMARGATWDPALEERVGEAIGMETAAKGGNVLLAPTMNVLRHPAWGRAQETYGEDATHIGAMAVAFIEGAQRHVMASAKHFVANSIEDTRFDVDVTMSERTLREQYLPHFRRAVQDADVASVMSAYNSVNGSFCAENAHLLRDILKGEWGFEGFVESDWVFGTKSTVPSALAGLDVEMPTAGYFGPELKEAVEAGQVDEAIVDEAVGRVLRRKLEYPLPGADAPSAEVVESEDHLALAQEVAVASLVLLKNEAALPLSDVTQVTMVGSLADVANMGDEGSSAVSPSSSISPYAGMVTRLGDTDVALIDRDVLETGDEAMLAASDAAVVVVGLTAEDEGENIGMAGGDRDDLALSAEHQALVAAVAAAQPRTVVVLEGGAALTMEGWLEQVPAVMMAWYPGQQGGLAIADALLGEVDPSGRLPISFPVDASQLPAFDHTSDAVSYGYFHGYRHLDHEGLDPLFPFGFGLSYTTFSYDALRVVSGSVGEGDRVEVEVDITNTGTRAGAEVVQLYVAFDDPPLERAPIELKAFAKTEVEAGASTTVALSFEAAELGYYDGGWKVSPGAYRILAGSSSRELPLEGTVQLQ